MGENDETGVTEGISQHPASQEGANVAGSGALSLWSGPGFFNAPYFKMRVLKRAATHPGSKWFIVTTARSIASTAPERRCWKRYRKTCARGLSGSASNLRTEVRTLLKRSGVQTALGDGALFLTLKSAVDACVSGGFAETLEAGTEPS
jgi:hypothetical protein